MVCFGPAADLHAFTLEAPGLAVAAGGSDEPFGRPISALESGGIWNKWLDVGHRLADDGVQLALCDSDRDRCVSPAALRFLAIIDQARARDGRGRLGEINRAINLAIRPMSDLAQYGAIDQWSSPLETFASGAGDCEDYAIAKFVALSEAGVPPENLRIVILRDRLSGEDHAVAAAKLDGHWLMLDNRRMAMIEDISMRNTVPLFVIDRHAIMKYSDVAPMADAPDPHREALMDLF
jgi:predicted transglutaminase-like cysteine proteinase